MIGERLKEIRRSRKIKQKDLGEILGVQKTNISLYESGKSTPNDIIKKKIAQFFNISIDYLVGLIDEPTLALSEQSEGAFLFQRRQTL